MINDITLKDRISFYEGINTINNIKFQINNEMLDFVITEWGNPDSIFFKWYNINKEIYYNDSKEIKKEKLKHNPPLGRGIFII